MSSDLDDLFTRATEGDRGVRRRAADDVPRSGDETPWAVPDPLDLTKAGTPRLLRCGRPSNSFSFGSFSLQRHREGFVVKGLALMMPSLLDALGHYPEQWNLTDKRTRLVMNTALVEGIRHAGYWVLADRGTLEHTVMHRVASAMIAGGSGADVDLEDLVEEAVALGLSRELLVESRSIFVEFFTRVAVPLAAEVAAVNTTYRKLGTADLVLRWLIDVPELGIVAGDVTGADLKTGRVDELTVLEQHTQLACYFGVGSEQYVYDDPLDLDDLGHPAPWPWPIRRDVAVLLHLPLADAIKVGDLRLELVGIDLKIGIELLDLADAVHSASADFTGRTLVTRRSLDQSQLLTDLQASLDAVAHDRVCVWLHGRLIEIGKLGPALTLLRELWPTADIPTTAVRDRTLAPEHVDLVDRLLAYVEAEFHIRFPARDPRMALTGPKTSPFNGKGKPHDMNKEG